MYPKIIRKMKSLLFLCFCVAMAFSAMASSVSDTYVIPNPQQMVCGDGHFVLRAQASFSCNLTGTDKDDFVSYVSNSPFALTYKKKGKADIVFKLVSPENAKMKEEAYRSILRLSVFLCSPSLLVPKCLSFCL